MSSEPMSASDRQHHLRDKHGYDIPYSVAAASSTLRDEHQRIHEDGTAIHLDHTHPEGTW